MAEIYRFVEVSVGDAGRKLTFVLHSGETRLLQLASRDEKESLLDMAIGSRICIKGKIEIVQGDRRFHHAMAFPSDKDRRRMNLPVPLVWKPLHQSRPGRAGWVAGNGGLISNLKVWENATLPLWYHARYDVAETELRVQHWLALLGLEPEEFAPFMSAPPAGIEPWQKKLAGLLRALVLMPRVMVVDAVLFEDIKVRLAQKWMAALEAYAVQDRAVLVITDKATTLPWTKIE